MKKILVVAFLLTFSTPFFASAAGGFHQPNGQSCIDATDCVSGYCNSNNICAPNSQTSSPSAGGNTSDGFTALAPIPGLTDPSSTSAISSTSLANFFNNLYKYLIGLAAVLAVIEIIWGGIEISTKDSVSKQSDGKERITQAIFGLILVLSPVLVFSIINPSILNLSLNLPPISLNTPAYTAAGGSTTGNGATQTTDSATQCTVTGAPNILQFATCPSAAAATTWGQQNCPDPEVLRTITTPPNLQNNAGTITTVTCTKRDTFDFIRVGSGLVPNQLQPLAVTSNSTFLQGSQTIYQTNGSDAVQYANICQKMGLETCVNHAPTFTFSHPCLPAPSTAAPATAPKPIECYTETVSCKDASSVNLYCVSSPSWTPFQ
ncbi:MAG: hypothetical protein ACYCZZ_01845 [Minisyncoccota bacterium]